MIWRAGEEGGEGEEGESESERLVMARTRKLVPPAKSGVG